MRGAKGRPVLRDPERAKLGFPLAFFFCLLFFFLGFFGSMFVSQDFLNFGRVRRVRLMELSREAESYAGVPLQAAEILAKDGISAENEDRALWKLGTLPPGLLTFYKLIHPLNKS